MLKFIFLLLLVVSCSHEKSLTESDRIEKFFDIYFEEKVSRYPTWQTYLGRKTHYGSLNNETEAYELAEHQKNQEYLKTLKSFNFDELNDSAKLSYKILQYQLDLEIEGFQWRYHSFPLNQMFGYQSETPSFLINMHQIDNKSDAEAYISRLKEIKRVFAERMVFVKKQTKLGIVPPHFVFSKIVEDSKNIISEQNNPLMNDFKGKLEKLNLTSDEKGRLLADAEEAMDFYVRPAYRQLISYVTDLSKKYKKNNGAWSLPKGKDYYNYRLRSTTTTNLTAEQIHEIGKSEVARIQKEMHLIMKQVGFTGSLQAFFRHLRSNEFTYPNTNAGRKAYLDQVNLVLGNIKAALPQLFNTFPKAELVVKPVEAYREKSAGTAFYSGPSMEGNRPGIYYVNLYKMADNPKYKLEALAYHEAIPGHHMQIAIANELAHLPKFRRDGGFTAYIEGWGLYAELLPKEVGFYQDPYSDFGRLSMEIWRAVRLVVDTGIHSKKWSREEAIHYMKSNTPSADLETVKEIERYFVMPGQATAYKVGMLKFLELREKSRKAMGEKFDVRKYHDIALRDGAIPLDILEEQVNTWIQKESEL